MCPAIWRSTDQTPSGFCSNGYTCTIQPKICGMNFPPAASQSALVEIDPARPNLGFTPHASCLFFGRNTHVHVRMPLGDAERNRLSSSFQLAFLGAVYMTPISLYSLPFL